MGIKIAIASEEKTENATVSSISGRASYYHIYEDNKLVEIIKNPFKVGGGGAGPAVAQMLINKGVNKIYAGKFGDKMKKALDENNIETINVTDTKIYEIISEN